MNNQSNNRQNLNLKNAQAAQAKFNMESGSDLAQSQGTISRTLLAKAKSGFEFGSFGAGRAGANQSGTNQAGSNQYQPQSSQFEFGNLGSNRAGANQPQSSQLDIERSNGQISKILEKESR